MSAPVGSQRLLSGAITVMVLLMSGVIFGPHTTVAQSPITGDAIPCTDGTAEGYPCENVELLSYLPIDAIGGGEDVQLNDIWGWTDPQTGTEYALVGRSDGVAFVDVSSPTDPEYLGELPSQTTSSPWRDVKVYRNYAFVVSEAPEHGMQIFDLTTLRTVREPDQRVVYNPTAHYDRMLTAHNVIINRASGFAYIVGGHEGDPACGGGLHMVDIRSPESPTFAGCFADPSTGREGTGYTHDGQCVLYQGPDPDYQNREVCFGANETAVNIADVTDKNAPHTIANATYPNIGYTHQVWLTEDHRYLYVDDELDERRGLVDSTRTLVFDVTDLDDPALVESYTGRTRAVDHNQYIDGTYAYQANYESGLRILDVAQPEQPEEVGFFDTYPDSNEPTFRGAWSTYPFFASGTVLISSIGQGLFVVRPQVGPVIDLSASPERRGASLQWRFADPADTDRVVVERRRLRGETWRQLETLSGPFTSQQSSYTATGLRAGTYQFRVVHVDPAGTRRASRTVSVQVLPEGDVATRGPFPNPVRGTATFTVTLRRAQTLRLTLFDALGREVAVLHDGPVPKGVEQRFQIRSDRRASGTYFLRGHGESVQFVRKFTVVR